MFIIFSLCDVTKGSLILTNHKWCKEARVLWEIKHLNCISSSIYNQWKLVRKGTGGGAFKFFQEIKVDTEKAPSVPQVIISDLTVV